MSWDEKLLRWRKGEANKEEEEHRKDHGNPAQKKRKEIRWSKEEKKWTSKED